MNLPLNVSESTRRRNPGLFGPVGTVEAHQPQSDLAPALVGRIAKRAGGKEGVRARVALIACVRRPLDDDNLTGSLKPLRDAVAAQLGIDDGDRRIVWDCQQVPTKGREGVIVKVEAL